MKIALKCNSPLLENSLSIFLESFICSKKHCDFIVSDYEIETKKPVFFIDTKQANITKPFTKEQLLSSLRKFYEDEELEAKNSKANNELDEKLDVLMQEFRKNLIKILSEHCES